MKPQTVDEQIAITVMGWQHHHDETGESGTWESSVRFRYYQAPDGTITQAVPQYSSDIVLAWEVIRAMRERGFNFCLADSGHLSLALDVWIAIFTPGETMRIDFRSHAQTAPAAICDAALKAIEYRTAHPERVS